MFNGLSVCDQKIRTIGMVQMTSSSTFVLGLRELYQLHTTLRGTANFRQSPTNPAGAATTTTTSCFYSARVVTTLRAGNPTTGGGLPVSGEY